ncbi:MAG TPA: NADP-dependent isocitrate dehydrogenase, partial [Acidimicrobiia bacterium]|nr:NADP-dependent isocitrate dehydrogenase [Acidimicrobiia bacterium]
MPSDRHTIIYTHTDEAPALATRSLLPVVNAFTDVAGVQVELRDISLAGRVLANFPEALTPEQRVSDALAELGVLVERPEANVIKLPNISASIPQLKATIDELRAKGFSLPDYPDEPSTPEEHDVKARYDKVKGSAVNPVLRQGNSDRRAPLSVKNYAKSHPPRMGAWAADSKTRVATMGANDFRSNEQSVTFDADDDLRVELVGSDGNVTLLKESIPVLAGEIVDATFMSAQALDAFLAAQMADAKANDVLFSIHLKATMMKVSDPILFGHAVKTYFADVFAKHADVFDRIGVNANDGMADVLTRVAALPDAERAAIEADVQTALATGPALAMVDSDRGITNLHVPSDIIIDASMPPMIRDSGRMWNAAGDLQDTLAVIPDSSYAGVYAAVVDDCRTNGAFDPSTLGSVPNVGLMAQQAEEYGSHDKTFEIPVDGTVRVLNRAGNVVLEHEVAAGDVWRACQVKDAPVRDWVGLAVRRARLSATPIVFWLDETRAHDAQIIAKVRQYLPEHDTSGLTIEIMAPADACRFSLERIRRGEDTISV